MIFFLILGVLLGAVSVIFIAQNTLLVTVTLLSWEFTGSLATVLMLTIAAGIVTTLLFILPSLIRETWYVSTVERRVTDLEKQLAIAKQELADVLVRTTVVDRPPLS